VGDVLLAVVGAAVGYVFGVLRALSESRNERRDGALAEIYKELSLFHRYLISWTDGDDPSPYKPTAESGGIPARKHVKDQYNKFAYTFHDVNAIWLGKDTYDLIQEFSIASRDLLNELNSMKEIVPGLWRLPGGRHPKDLREERRITPMYMKVRNELRTEVETSRDLVAWFRYQIDKRKRLG
jgi:hypothetical protein